MTGIGPNRPPRAQAHSETKFVSDTPARRRVGDLRAHRQRIGAYRVALSPRQPRVDSDLERQSSIRSDRETRPWFRGPINPEEAARALRAITTECHRRRLRTRRCLPRSRRSYRCHQLLRSPSRSPLRNRRGDVLRPRHRTGRCRESWCRNLYRAPRPRAALRSRCRTRARVVVRCVSLSAPRVVHAQFCPAL